MTHSTSHDLPQDLGNGLVLRRATSSDSDALAEFNGMIHREPDQVEPDISVAGWVRDLLNGQHPTFPAEDFTLVEEQATGRIVSSLNLISQTWTYAGIPFKVGRPELVGTLPEFRKQGLIRRQFDIIHAWSAERGELAQAITGIPYYYRQFGYEMTIDLGGGRIAPLMNIPKLKEGQAEPYRLRSVTEADLAFVRELDEHATQRSLVTCPRDETMWRYELFGKRSDNANRNEWRILETVEGRPVGLTNYFGMWLWGPALGIMYLELVPGVSWVATAPSILRGLQAEAEAVAARTNKPLGGLRFNLGSEHPFYTVTHDRLPVVKSPYAWYMRVPDMPAFLRHITPVLEERLRNSPAVGHTGELKLSFYRNGIRLTFDAGRITSVEPWMPTHEDGGSAAFPGLTFLQLLFGYRTLDELRAAFVDCWTEGDDERSLVLALFPRQSSRFLPVS